MIIPDTIKHYTAANFLYRKFYRLSGWFYMYNHGSSLHLAMAESFPRKLHGLAVAISCESCA